MTDLWTWLISDRSLAPRVAIGAAIFLCLALIDIYNNGSRATRWREYAFLVACVALAMTYGIVNDLITSRISPEYFLFFKGAAERLSPEAAADPAAHRGALDLQAIRIGALATWTAGLIAGALLLTVNSLGKRPPLPLRRLGRLVPILFVGAVAGAVALGIIGGKGGLAWTSGDFRTMVAADEMRPYRVMCVYGIHLGGYAGAGLGLAMAIGRVVVLRSTLAKGLSHWRASLP